MQVQASFDCGFAAGIAFEELRTNFLRPGFCANVASSLDEASCHGIVHAIAATTLRAQHGMISELIKWFAASARFGVIVASTRTWSQGTSSGTDSRQTKTPANSEEEFVVVQPHVWPRGRSCCPVMSAIA